MKQPTLNACPVILHLAVVPGPSSATDPLPPSLTADPASALAYRVRILSPNNRSAGLSTPAIALAGAPPPAVAGLRAIPTRSGVILEWQPLSTPSLIELQRALLALSAVAPRKSASPLAPPPDATEIHLRTGNVSDLATSDPGGTLDHTAQRTQTYSYSAQRIRTVPVDGHVYEIRSELSSPITVKISDTFPPLTPTGLAAVPSDNGTSPDLDLSWEPDTDPDLAGYNVYRRSASGAFQRINQQLVVGPAFTDTAVTPGTAYTYRVTAVDNTGNESPPSTEVTETARPKTP
jgi:hypothetical protein